jgi:hypothetical protein
LADANQFLADHSAANEPPPIRQLSAPELKALIEGGTPFELVDVRTDEERAREDRRISLDRSGVSRRAPPAGS